MTQRQFSKGPTLARSIITGESFLAPHFKYLQQKSIIRVNHTKCKGKGLNMHHTHSMGEIKTLKQIIGKASGAFTCMESNHRPLVS